MTPTMHELSRDEALVLIRRKGLWSGPARGTLAALYFLLRSVFGAVDHALTGHGDEVVLDLVIAAIPLVALALLARPAFRQWRSSRQPEGVIELVASGEGPMENRFVRDEAGRLWDAGLTGTYLPPGTHLWATPLREGEPHFVILPGITRDDAANRVVYHRAGPRRVDPSGGA